MQKMTQNKQYDHEYKVQAIKLAREIGSAKAAAELGVPKNTMYGWMRAVREGRLDIGKGAHCLLYTSSSGTSSSNAILPTIY